MALTKVKGSGVEGITNLSNATFLSVDASEVATFLTSAVIKTEGGTATKNIAQSMPKMWCNLSGTGPTINDSINLASVTDTGVGQRTTVYTTAFANTAYAMAGGQSSSGGTSGNTGVQYAAVGTASANNLTFTNGSVVDDTLTSIFCGELA